MGAMASQITGPTIVYSTVYSGADQRKKLRVTGLCAWNSPVTGEFPTQRASNAKNVPFDDVIMMKRIGNRGMKHCIGLPFCI